jgi:hypothetical protein
VCGTKFEIFEKKKIRTKELTNNLAPTSTPSIGNLLCIGKSKGIPLFV